MTDFKSWAALIFTAFTSTKTLNDHNFYLDIPSNVIVTTQLGSDKQ